MDWAAHVARMWKMINIYKILVVKYEGKNPLVRCVTKGRNDRVLRWPKRDVHSFILQETQSVELLITNASLILNEFRVFSNIICE
jgi:hypothetical protein